MYNLLYSLSPCGGPWACSPEHTTPPCLVYALSVPDSPYPVPKSAPVAPHSTLSVSACPLRARIRPLTLLNLPPHTTESAPSHY
eukprot:2791971-Pyramimonas_sp.AAC.1